jgi:hypothetical protein
MLGGGHARVEGISGTRKYLTGGINSMAGNPMETLAASLDIRYCRSIWAPRA